MALWVAVLLVLYNNLNNLIPQPLHDLLFVPLNLTAGLLVVLWARSAGLSWDTLGLVLGRPRQSLRWGVGVGLALTAPLFLALVIPGSVDPFADARDFGDLGLGGLAYQTLLRIPLGTALLEEVAFRGVLYGLLYERSGSRVAFVGSSAAFGLWHVAPTLELLRGSDLFPTVFLLGLGVAGGVVAAGVGGLLFCWLRLRTGGVYGPFLTHWLINALGAVAAFMVAR